MPVRDVRVAAERWRRRARDEQRAHATPESVLGSIPARVQSGQVVPVEEIEMPVIEADAAVGDGGDGESKEASQFVVRNEWTALQGWSIFGFATCTVPWYMKYDKEKKEYVMKSHWIQKIFCILQHLLTIIDALATLSDVPSLMSKPTPFSYIHFSGLLLSIVTRLWFAKAVFLNKADILDHHNMPLYLDETPTGENIECASEAQDRVNGLRQRKEKHSKVMGMGMTSVFFLFALLLIGADFGMQLKAYDRNWKEGGLPTAIQATACYARKTYLWKDDDTCGSDYIVDNLADMPASEMSWGIWGFMTFINAKTAQYQIFNAINVSNWVFYCDAVMAMWIIQNTDQPAIRAYDYLKTRAEMLSGFSGILLFLQLIEIATKIPTWSVMLFLDNVFVSVYIVSIAVGFFPFVVVGCYGALISEKIKDEVGGSRGRTSRPSTPRQMSAFLFRLIRNDVGIGIPGIFVLNFGFLTAYMSVAGTFIMVLYEVQHGKN